MGPVHQALGPVRRMEMYSGGAWGSKAQKARNNYRVINTQAGFGV